MNIAFSKHALSESGDGTLFKVTVDGTFTLLHQFGSDLDTNFEDIAGGWTNYMTVALDGFNPVGGLVQGSDGAIYGTTRSGGASLDQEGTVFKLKVAASTSIRATGVVTVVNGFIVEADIVNGGSGYTEAPAVSVDDATGSNAIIVASISSAGVVTNLSIESAGLHYSSNPTLVIAPPSEEDGTFLTNLYSFSGGPDGSQPLGTLILAGDGNLYGTTVLGGTYSAGTVFGLTTSGILTNLYSFPASFFGLIAVQGEYPVSELIQGADGRLFGTALAGGTGDGNGTFFALTIVPPLNAQASVGFGGSGDGWVLNNGDGVVPVVSGNILTLTTGKGGNNSAFFGTPQAIDGTCQVHFVWTVTDNNNGNPGDGFTFTIQDQGLEAVATNGVGTLGYSGGTNSNSDGIADSFAVAIDNSSNDGGPMLELGSNGAFISTNSLSDSGIDFSAQDDPIAFRIDFNQTGALTVSLTQGTHTFLQSFSLSGPLSSLVGADTAYVGFTGSTASSSESQVISDFSFTTTAPTATRSEPPLAITLAGNSVILAWPASATDFSLQSTTNLASPQEWKNVSTTPIVVSGQNTVTNPITDAAAFFRLAR